MDYLGQRLKGILEWKNLTIQNVYGAEPYDYDTLMAWLEKFGGQLRPYICDAGSVLRLAQLRGKNILFEAQLGALRDIDYGIYPYTSSSTPPGRLCAHRLRRAGSTGGRGAGHCEGLFHLRGGRPLYRGMVWGGGGQAAGSRRRIRRGHRPAPAG